MTEAELLQRIYTRIGGERKSGIIKPILMAYVPDALSTACKLIATHQPTGHHKLLTDVNENTFTLNDDNYLVFTIPDTVIEQTRFHSLIARVSGNEYDCEPVYSYRALSLAAEHGIAYYYLNNDKVYIALPTGTSLDDVTIRHYVYATLTQFPAELVEILIEEILKLISLTAIDLEPKSDKKK